MTNKVKELLYKMITTNTGSALCDSGGAYGRHHEKNSVKTMQDFDNDKAVDFDSMEGASESTEIDYTISTWHYLNNHGFELDTICNDFNEIQKDSDDWDTRSKLYGVSYNAFENYLDCNYEVAIQSTWNTYNRDTNLSQVLQGAYLTVNGEDYILLQIHQGCDVRGGYTDAKLFKNEDIRGYGLNILLPEDVYGTIDDEQVDNTYNGYSLTDEQGNSVPVNPDSEIELYMIGE